MNIFSFILHFKGYILYQIIEFLTRVNWYFLRDIFIEKEPEKREKYFKFKYFKILKKTLMLLAGLREFNYQKSNYL